MAAQSMPSNWRDIIRAKRVRTVYRIVLTVRGKTIIKEYGDEEEFRRWKQTYRHWVDTGSIEHMETYTVYQ